LTDKVNFLTEKINGYGHLLIHLEQDSRPDAAGWRTSMMAGSDMRE